MEDTISNFLENAPDNIWNELMKVIFQGYHG